MPSYRSVIGSDGRERRLTSAIFTQLDIFSDTRLRDSQVEIVGLVDRKRKSKWLDIKYLEDSNSNIWGHKVIISAADGAAGLIGETPARITGKPLKIGKLSGITQTFVSFGNFIDETHASNLEKYMLTKFTRFMVGTLKATNGTKYEVWKNVPIQNFTNNSDIDWSKSIPEIDQQLYKKYGLSQEEIDFIESRVKPMV